MGRERSQAQHPRTGHIGVPSLNFYMRTVTPNLSCTQTSEPYLQSKVCAVDDIGFQDAGAPDAPRIPQRKICSGHIIPMGVPILQERAPAGLPLPGACVRVSGAGRGRCCVVF